MLLWMDFSIFPERFNGKLFLKIHEKTGKDRLIVRIAFQTWDDCRRKRGCPASD